MAIGHEIRTMDHNPLWMAGKQDNVKTRCSRSTSTSGQLTDNGPARLKPTAISATQFSLGDLPNELLGHIIDYLDSEAPSEVNWNQRPDITLTQSETADLKTISRTSKHLRHLVLPRLFAHMRLDPNQAAPFLSFARRNNLTNHISSLVAHLSGSCTHIHPVWWSHILTSIPLTTLTIVSSAVHCSTGVRSVLEAGSI